MRKFCWVALVMMISASLNAYAARQRVVIATGGIGAPYYSYGTKISEILNRNGIMAKAIQTAAPVDNLLLVRDKTNESKDIYYFATVLSDTAYFAVTGKYESFVKNPLKAQVLWMMYPSCLQILTTDKSGITRLADLSGKRVSTGRSGSGTEFSALSLLAAAGIKGGNFKEWEKLGPKESAQALLNGTLDAFFESGKIPTASIAALSSTLKRRGENLFIVPLPESDPMVARFKTQFPGLAETRVIPKSAYHTASDTPTIAFWNMLVCPESTPVDLAYKVTRAVFENLASLKASIKAARETTPENTARFIGKAPIAFHPGAVEYFKKLGLVK